MRVIVNQQEYDLPHHSMVSDALTLIQAKPPYAVAVNLQFVPKSKHTQYPLNEKNPTEWPLYDNTKIAVKLGIVLIILVLGYRQNKKSVFTTGTWATMLGLTVANIVIAYSWH